MCRLQKKGLTVVPFTSTEGRRIVCGDQVELFVRDDDEMHSNFSVVGDAQRWMRMTRKRRTRLRRATRTWWTTPGCGARRGRAPPTSRAAAASSRSGSECRFSGKCFSPMVCVGSVSLCRRCSCHRAWIMQAHFVIGHVLLCFCFSGLQQSHHVTAMISRCSQKHDEMKEDEIEEYYRQKYADSTAVGLYGEGEEMSDEITQQGLLPGVKYVLGVCVCMCVCVCVCVCVCGLLVKSGTESLCWCACRHRVSVVGGFCGVPNEQNVCVCLSGSGIQVLFLATLS